VRFPGSWVDDDPPAVTVASKRALLAGWVAEDQGRGGTGHGLLLGATIA
jgi:hypothetical protein